VKHGFSQLALSGVGIEKLLFCTIGLKSGDRKCPPDPRKTFVGHPGAMNFPRVSEDEFFNTHRPMHSSKTG
jgi:hypothetical protein